jgi:hypothetical protein
VIREDAAEMRGFRPAPLGVRVTVTLKTEIGR